MSRYRLCLFTRFPTPGQAKTRLIPALGAEHAARLHRRMSEEMAARCEALSPTADLEVRVTGAPLHAFQNWLGVNRHYAQQGEGDLGARLESAIRDALADGKSGVLLLGSDCPDLSTDLLRQAIQVLESHDAVLGPAFDGGYYLLGLRRSSPLLFKDMPWSTDQVAALTRQRLATSQMSFTELSILRDIDTPADYAAWQASGPKL